MILDTFTFLFKPEGQEKVKEAAKGLTDFFGQQAEAQKVKLDNLMGIVAPLIAAYGTLRTIMSFTEDNEQLYNVSNMTGIATQSMRELGFATEQFGGGLSSAVGTLSHLQSMIQQVRTTGGGALTSAAAKYGLAFSSDPEQLLRNIAKRMEGMTKAQQVDFGRMLGLDNPTIQLLQKGLKGVNEELKRAHELNFMDEETLEASHALVKDIREMVILFKGMAQTMSVQFHPELQSIVSAIRNGSLYLLKHREVLESIAQKILWIGKLYAGWKLASLLTSPKGLMGLSIAGAGILQEDYKVWKRLKKTGNAELDEKLRENTLMGRFFGIGEDAVKKFDEDWNNLTEHVKKTITDYIDQSEYLKGVKSIWESVWEDITNEKLSIIDKIKAIGQGIANTFELTFETVKDKIEKTKFGKYILDLLDNTIEDAKEIGWFNSLKNMFSKLFDDLTKIIEPQIEKFGEKIDELFESDSDEDNPFIDFVKDIYDRFLEWLENTDTYQEFSEWLENLGNDLEVAFDEFSKKAKINFSLTSMIRDALGAKKDETILQALTRKLGEMIEGAVSSLQKNEKFQKAVAQFNKDFWDALGVNVDDKKNKTFVDKIGTAAENAVAKLKEVFKKNKDSIKESISSAIADGIIDGITSLPKNIADRIKNSDLFQGAKKDANEMIDKVKDWINPKPESKQSELPYMIPENDSDLMKYVQQGNSKDLNMQAIAELTKPNQLNTTNNTITNTTTNNTNHFHTPISNDQYYEMTRNTDLYHVAGGR